MARKKQEEEVEQISMAQAIRDLCSSKNLPLDEVLDAFKEALKKAYFKYSGDYTDTIINVNIDLTSGSIEMYKVKNVVEEIQDDVFETDPEEAYEETGIHYNVGDVVLTPIDINNFKRAAAMQAKSVFKQKLREAEKQSIEDKFKDKVGDIMNGTVELVDDKHAIIKISGTNAYLSRAKTLPNDNLRVGNKVMVYVEDVVKTSASSTPINVSRVHPRLVTKLMEREIPDIADGTVEIKAIARTPGIRSKVAVYSKDPNIDPSGSCIGPRGSIISKVFDSIAGEKIDVVNYYDNPLLYVADALKPAQIVGVQMLDEEEKKCRAIVSEDQFSLAIGKEAQNVNLAVRLTGWKIDIKKVSEAEEEGIEYQTVEDLKLLEKARKARPTTPVTRVVPVTTANNEETKVVEEDIKVVDTPVEETPVEEDIKVVTPTKSKDVDLSIFEGFLDNNKPTKKEAPKKKYVKKTEEVKQDVEEGQPKEKEDKKKDKDITPKNVLPIYTEEELKELEEQEQEEENSKYDDEIDYDEFDDYYEDN